MWMQLTLYHNNYKQGHVPLLNYVQNINKGFQGIKIFMASFQKPIGLVVIYK
jgi:hypothetical protein